ncbi:phage-related protein [Methanobacterium formicicum]|uniref:Phage-related protein n=1 Tax=Methanobacterium formicicum TaxID=2162 RepID=A0A089ZII4_METFO|nr:phage tail domain-containing protein [Methanobacterium formicicum]AIS32493.1 phage-related protein [Methanobacterium formicicum]
MLFDFTGRISLDYILMDDGTPIIPGTRLTQDGELLFEFTDHTIPIYALTSKLPPKAEVGKQISYDIQLECTNQGDPGRELIVSVPIPAGFNLIKASSNEGTYNSTNGKWTLILDSDDKAYLNLILSGITAGSWDQTITLDGTITSITKNCEVVSSDSEGSIASHSVDLANYPITLANMQDGQTYTIVTYSKVHETGVTGIHAGVKNNTISVSNGVQVIGTRATIQDNIQKITCTFIYDSNHDCIITWFDEYQSISTATEDRHYGLCLNEGFDTNYYLPKDLLSQPTAMLDDTGATDLFLEGNSQSAEYIYSFPVPDILPDNSFFVGVEVFLNSFSPSSIEIFLVNDGGESSQLKSEFFEGSGKVEFGDLADLWDLKDTDIKDHQLEIHVKFSNNTLYQQKFTYSNLTLVLYYIEDETGQSRGFYLDGVHGRNYGIFVNGKVEITEGVNLDIETLELDSSVGELVTGSKIKSKELKVPFEIFGCSIEEAKNRLSKAVRWMASDINRVNIPIPKKLVFEWDPSHEYNVVLKGDVDNDFEYGSYTCKAVFLVPDGLVWSQSKTTGPSGVNLGRVPVWPVIYFRTNGSSQIVLTESVSGATLKINETIPENTLMVLDCINRQLYEMKTNVYHTTVSLDSVWPQLIKEYKFTATGAVIQKIEYKEGY